MKNHFLMAAVAASLMLAGCGGSADEGEAVTVTVTGSANVRDAATAEGSSVLETLSAGTQLTGRWVESDTNPSEQWFEYERDGKKAYIWGRNLSEQFKQEASLPRSDLITSETSEKPIEKPILEESNLPKIAFACGGDGHRNGRIVFDPERGKIYNGSIKGMRDGTGGKWQSSYIRKDGENWYLLFQGTRPYPTSEAYFNPKLLILRENSNYEPGGREKADACYARIEKVKRECATAGDIDKCMEIRDRTAWAKNFAGSCSITAPRWLDFQCDDLTDDYKSILSQVREYPLFGF